MYPPAHYEHTDTMILNERRHGNACVHGRMNDRMTKDESRHTVTTHTTPTTHYTRVTMQMTDGDESHYTVSTQTTRTTHT